MGGNALAPYGARRFDRAEYLVLAKEVKELLKPIVIDRYVIEILSYNSKESFGDLDLVIPKLNPEQKRKVLGLFPDGHVDNMPKDKTAPITWVLSVLYKGLQVDLIQPEIEDIHTSLTYYAFNDLGNLMGVIYKQFGLRYGHRGLRLNLTEGTNKYAEILISKDSQKIFDFVGLSYTRFKLGFNTLEEVFDFVVNSPYFSPDLYQFENVNATSRIRDKKRSSYNAFLKYIANRKDTDKFLKNKAWYNERILSFFPEARPRFEAAVRKYDLEKQAKDRFNGTLVSEWTGLKEKELGLLMAKLRNERGPFVEWVLGKTEAELKEIVNDAT